MTNGEFEDTIRELFKSTLEEMHDSKNISHALKELEWKILCSYHMNEKSNSTSVSNRIDMRLRQMIPVELHDLNASLHS